MKITELEVTSLSLYFGLLCGINNTNMGFVKTSGVEDEMDSLESEERNLIYIKISLEKYKKKGMTTIQNFEVSF
jgi:hypothetical protein